MSISSGVEDGTQTSVCGDLDDHVAARERGAIRREWRRVLVSSKLSSTHALVGRACRCAFVADRDRALSPLMKGSGGRGESGSG